MMRIDLYEVEEQINNLNNLKLKCVASEDFVQASAYKKQIDDLLNLKKQLEIDFDQKSNHPEGIERMISDLERVVCELSKLKYEAAAKEDFEVASELKKKIFLVEKERNNLIIRSAQTSSNSMPSPSNSNIPKPSLPLNSFHDIEKISDPDITSVEASLLSSPCSELGENDMELQLVQSPESEPSQTSHSTIQDLPKKRWSNGVISTLPKRQTKRKEVLQQKNQQQNEAIRELKIFIDTLRKERLQLERTFHEQQQLVQSLSIELKAFEREKVDSM